MTREMLDYYKKEKEITDKLNFDGFTSSDYEIVSIVRDSIEETSRPSCTEKLTLRECEKMALEGTKILDKSYFDKLKGTNFVINTTNDVYDYNTVILNKYNQKNKTVSKKVVDSYIILPPKFNEISYIWLSHEYIHKLKDNIYDEFKSIYIEVLPLFYEIVIANNSNIDIHDKWKQARLHMFGYDKRICDLAMEKLNRNRDIDICKHIIESHSKYFLSYYYAVNLYNLYKEDPKQVLKYINKVLNNKITTKKMLDKLDIYKLKDENVKVYNLEHKKL